MSRFGLGFIGAGGVPGNDAFTKILLHMDGSNGGTSFQDVNVGGSAHTWTPTNATTSTAAAKFGTAALLTSVGYITTPDHADFTLGSADFTVDFWFNCNGTSGVVGLAGQMNAIGGTASISVAISRTAGGLIFVEVHRPGGITNFLSVTGFNGTSTWNHCAVVRDGPTLRLFINGTQEASSAISGLVNDSSNNWSVGRIGDNTSYAASSAKFDEFRLSVGVARWTSNFTPPVAQYI